MKLNAKQYATAWYQQLTTLTETDWPSLSDAMLHEIVRRGDMKLLPEVTRRVQDLYYKEQSLTPVTVTTAQLLPKAVIEQTVEKFFPLSRVALTTTEDVAMLGGIKVETRNQRWDMSLKRQLEQLANSLI